jgi:hypothetical protein
VYKYHPHHALWVAGFFLLPLGAIGGAISTCGMHKLFCFKRSTVAPLLAQQLPAHVTNYWKKIACAFGPLVVVAILMTVLVVVAITWEPNYDDYYNDNYSNTYGYNDDDNYSGGGYNDDDFY